MAPAALSNLVARLAEQFPHDLSGWLDAARGLIGAEQAGAAVELLDAASQRFPDQVELTYWRGNALRMSWRFVDAEKALREVLNVQHTHRDAALSLAIMLRDQGRLRAASETIVASAHARADQHDEILAALVFLRQCGQHPLAHELARTALKRWPQDPSVSALAAEFALAVGDFPAAREALHTTLRLNPEHAASWLRLAYCQHYSHADDPDVDMINRQWASGSTADETRACVGFALGKALDDLGEYEHAAGILRQANALAHSASPWSIDDWQAFVEQRLRQPALPQVGPAIDFTPVFIVGLPRTGTTLAATLLARDPQVSDRGELNWIDAMYRSLAQQGRLDDPSALRQIAQLVAAQMRRDDAPARWYLDKNPLNFRYLDLIAAMFPHAKIVHCRRHLRDTALSLWSQHFAHPDLAFAYDFSTIAAFVRGYEHLMAHWREHQPLPIYDLDYEALAGDTQNTLQHLTDFLDMPTPAVSETESATHAITTASVWQARQPVYQRSIGRWRRYAVYLPELEKLFPSHAPRTFGWHPRHNLA